MPKKWCPECDWAPHNRRTTPGRPTGARITKPANTKLALAMHRRHKHSEPPRPLVVDVPEANVTVATAHTEVPAPPIGVRVRFSNGEETIIQGDLFAKSAALVQVWQRGNEVARYPAQMVEHVELLAKATA